MLSKNGYHVLMKARRAGQLLGRRYEAEAEERRARTIDGFPLYVLDDATAQEICRRIGEARTRLIQEIEREFYNGITALDAARELHRAAGAPLPDLEDTAAQPSRPHTRDEDEAGWSRWVNEIASALDSEPMYADEESEISKGMTLDEWQAWTNQLIRETQQSG